MCRDVTAFKNNTPATLGKKNAVWGGVGRVKTDPQIHIGVGQILDEKEFSGGVGCENLLVCPARCDRLGAGGGQVSSVGVCRHRSIHRERSVVIRNGNWLVDGYAIGDVSFNKSSVGGKRSKNTVGRVELSLHLVGVEVERIGIDRDVT